MRCLNCRCFESISIYVCYSIIVNIIIVVNIINNNRIANIDRNRLKTPATQTSQINIENIENRNILSFNIPLMDMSVHGEGRTSRNHVSTAFIFDL